MTIKELYKEYKQLRKELNEEENKYKKLIKDRQERKSRLYLDIEKLFIENKLYCPISDLNKYKNEDIAEINLVVNDEIKYLSFKEIMKVDENGNFYMSDYESGIIEFNKDRNIYELHCWGSKEDVNIQGFYNLNLGCWYNTQRLIEETSYEYLINKADNNEEEKTTT